MSDSAEAAATTADDGGMDEGRRDFLYMATGAMGAMGLAASVWPFIDTMNPAADTLALASTEVDLSSIQEGQSITVKWPDGTEETVTDHDVPEAVKGK